MKEANVTYDKEEDILHLSESGKTVKYSIGVDDLFVVDFDASDRVIGIELLDASETVYGVSKALLGSITSAKFGARYAKELLVVGIMLNSSVAEAPIYSSVPIPIIAR